MTRDRVIGVKWESPAGGGTESDRQPSPLNPAEDYPQARGIIFQKYVGPGERDHSNDEAVGAERDLNDRLTFWDAENETPVPLTDLVAGSSGLTEGAHRVLDTLIHDLAEDGYEEYTYSGNRVTNITVWTDSGKTTKIREWQYTYSGRKVNTETVIQYNASGAEAERLTISYSYSGSRVISATIARTP